MRWNQCALYIRRHVLHAYYFFSRLFCCLTTLSSADIINSKRKEPRKFKKKAKKRRQVYGKRFIFQSKMSSARSSCRSSIFHWALSLSHVGSGKLINNIKYYCPLLFVEYNKRSRMAWQQQQQRQKWAKNASGKSEYFTRVKQQNNMLQYQLFLSK